MFGGSVEDCLLGKLFHTIKIVRNIRLNICDGYRTRIHIGGDKKKHPVIEW
jgi:hypothetical protein